MPILPAGRRSLSPGSRAGLGAALVLLAAVSTVELSDGRHAHYVGLFVAVPFLACLIVVVRHVLLTHIYGDHDPRVFESAVLVSTTGDRHAIAMSPQ